MASGANTNHSSETIIENEWKRVDPGMRRGCDMAYISILHPTVNPKSPTKVTDGRGQTDETTATAAATDAWIATMKSGNRGIKVGDLKHI